MVLVQKYKQANELMCLIVDFAQGCKQIEALTSCLSFISIIIKLSSHLNSLSLTLELSFNFLLFDSSSMLEFELTIS